MVLLINTFCHSANSATEFENDHTIRNVRGGNYCAKGPVIIYGRVGGGIGFKSGGASKIFDS